ncbi:hypothetical protein SAMN04487895_11847 [Paenibacillus sophorae]|uniref:DUF2933 domain-containing protein n=1 Tax=Paenibacillus sophorae TaxID=1333845 RepID=A0A1H8UNL9_9BACL|nr:hypothetical protein [Paenibacillus sophorae]QWU13304.1 hypothetical protein KP014_14935 [Paenibacillus sophorae]SEP04208.1 hypothetical protein SAMN04487895_11847 [Paenibacillus sophorae]
MNWSSLLVLVCPLMMVVMMLGMKGAHGHGHGKKDSHGVSASDSGIRQELDELKVQNAQMKRELEALSGYQKAE